MLGRGGLLRIGSGLTLCTMGFGTAAASTFVVANANDSGIGSLRQAIVDSNRARGSNRILFKFDGIIDLRSELPKILNNLEIDGAGKNLTISGTFDHRLFFIGDAAATKPIYHVRIQNLLFAMKEKVRLPGEPELEKKQEEKAPSRPEEALKGERPEPENLQKSEATKAGPSADPRDIAIGFGKKLGDIVFAAKNAVLALNNVGVSLDGSREPGGAPPSPPNAEGDHLEAPEALILSLEIDGSMAGGSGSDSKEKLKASGFTTVDAPSSVFQSAETNSSTKAKTVNGFEDLGSPKLRPAIEAVFGPSASKGAELPVLGQPIGRIQSLPMSPGLNSGVATPGAFPALGTGVPVFAQMQAAALGAAAGNGQFATSGVPMAPVGGRANPFMPSFRGQNGAGTISGNGTGAALAVPMPSGALEAVAAGLGDDGSPGAGPAPGNAMSTGLALSGAILTQGAMRLAAEGAASLAHKDAQQGQKDEKKDPKETQFPAPPSDPISKVVDGELTPVEAREYALGLLVAIATIATIMTAAMSFFQKDTLGKRMKSVATERDRIRVRERERMMAQKGKVSLRQEAKPFMKDIVERFSLSKWLGTDEAKAQLASAGYRGPQAEVAFLFFRLVTPATFFLLALIYVLFISEFDLPWVGNLGIVLAAAYIGIKAPELFIDKVIKKRRFSMGRAFPDAMDLLLICVESGMSIEHAFRKVGHEIGNQSVPLAEELMLTTAELSFLPDRKHAYENLSTRTGLESIRQIVTVLIQAERYGTPLGTALRVVAQESRNNRMMLAEKKAASLPPKLTVPMIVFFLPVLFAIIMTPAIIQISKSGVGN